MSKQQEISRTDLDGMVFASGTTFQKRVMLFGFGPDGERMQDVRESLSEVYEKNGKKSYTVPADIQAQQTKTVVFDFSGVTLKEVMDAEISQTTIYKKWYNNRVSSVKLTNDEWVKFPDKVVVNVRELLDVTRTTGTGAVDKKREAFSKAIDNLPADEAQAEVEKLLAQIKARREG